MADFLDTNIFITAVYTELHAKAVTKFLMVEDKDPMPYSLYGEIYEKFLLLFSTFQKASRLIETGGDYMGEIQTLLPDFKNVYNSINFKSKNFQDMEKLKEYLHLGLERVTTIWSFINNAKFYPSTTQEEKNILEKYKFQIEKLKKIKELHNADLKIVVILYHYYKNQNEIARLVSRDGKLYFRKSHVEKEFPAIKIIKCTEYLEIKEDILDLE